MNTPVLSEVVNNVPSTVDSIFRFNSLRFPLHHQWSCGFNEVISIVDIAIGWNSMRLSEKVPELLD